MSCPWQGRLTVEQAERGDSTVKNQYLALDYGGTFTKYALMDREGRFLCEGKVPSACDSLEHMLACVAPRALFIGSAQEDEWADPLSEYLCAEAASRAYRALGARGFISQGQPAPAPEQALFDGEIGYLMRRGGHAVIRADWLAHMRFRQMRGV